MSEVEIVTKVVDLGEIERRLCALDCVLGVTVTRWDGSTGEVVVDVETELFEESRSDRDLVYTAETEIITGHPGVTFEFRCRVARPPALHSEDDEASSAPHTPGVVFLHDDSRSPVGVPQPKQQEKPQ